MAYGGIRHNQAARQGHAVAHPASDSDHCEHCCDEYQLADFNADIMNSSAIGIYNCVASSCVFLS